MQRIARTRGVRGAAGWCALAVWGYLVAGDVLRGVVSALMGLRVTGASLGDPVGFTPAAAEVLSMLVSAGTLAAPVLLLLLVTRLRPQDLRVLLPSQWSPWFCLGLFLGLANLTNLLCGLLNLLLGKSPAVDAVPASGAPLVLDFLLLCVLPAVGEELLFRGALQGLMRPCGSAVAIFGPALLFALLHLDLTQSLTALSCGLFLGWLAERTGSILPGMLLHFANNCIAFGNLYLQLYAPAQAALAVQAFILLFFPLLGLVLLWHALRQDFRFSAGMRSGPAAWAVFTSPAYTLTALLLLVYTIVLGAAV